MGVILNFLFAILKGIYNAQVAFLNRKVNTFKVLGA
jgi:hypothetical protein